MYTTADIANLYDHASDEEKQFLAQVIGSVVNNQPFIYIKGARTTRVYTSSEEEFIAEVQKCFFRLATKFAYRRK